MKALFCILIALAITGCSVLSKPENQPLARAGVQYATAKLIEQGNPAKERAGRIKAIAIDLQSLFKADEQATIPALEALIREKVREPLESLSPADRMLAENLIAVVVQELQARLGKGVLAPDQMIVVNDILQWVIDATVYGGA
jgi:hypothetical protein